MNRCPQCFEGIDPSLRFWVCVNPRCAENGDDPVATAYNGASVKKRPAYRDSQAEMQQRAREHPGARMSWPPATPACPACKEPMADACTHCHYAFPPGWMGVANVTCIAMSGARASGKSLHIAVGVKKLESYLLEHANSQMRPYTHEVDQVFRVNYLDPLYVARGVLQSTPNGTVPGAYQRQPLIFDLGQLRGRRQFLVIRDVAGEEMQNLPADRKHLEFLARADAVFFLFDPLAVPDIRASLKDVIALPVDQGGDPLQVMNNLLTLIKGATGGAGAIPPMAVIMSKFDALEEFRSLEGKPDWSALMSHRGAAFARDPSERQLGYDRTDGDLLSAEIRSLVLKLGARGLVSTLENPADGRPVENQFFAVSVLGHAPRGQSLDPRGIAPFRAIDPFKWVLSRNGVI